MTALIFPQSRQRFPSPQLLSLILAILVGSKWRLVVSICTSLVTNDIEHLHALVGPFVYLLGEINVYSRPLVVFLKLDCLSFCGFADEF